MRGVLRDGIAILVLVMMLSAAGMGVGYLERRELPFAVGLLAVVAGTLTAFILTAVAWVLSDGWLGGKRRTSGSTDGTRRALTRMRRSAAPTLLLVPAKSPGFSKLGCFPELPSGMPWPHGTKEPRTFVAQIDFATIAASGAFDWLPSEGRIYLFIDDWRAGFSDYGVTLFTTETEVAERAPPAKPSELFKERRVAFLQMESVPSLDWLGVNLSELNVSEEELDYLAGLPDEPFGDEIQHRIGGYPSEIQDSQMQIECELLRRGLRDTPQDEVSDAVRRASKQWRMLLQIDADPDLGMKWGDAGCLYVFVRKSDAARRDFSKTITLWQTH
jgi:uncharacterized protein YwqG